MYLTANIKKIFICLSNLILLSKNTYSYIIYKLILFNEDKKLLVLFYKSQFLFD